MSAREADIVVIGAGPAGSVAGAALARAGRRVTIIESKPFPRAKVCGEFVSPSVTALLERLIPASALRSAGARRVDRLVLRCGRLERCWALPEPAWALSRRSLDELLLARAREAGARVRQPASVRGVSYSDECVEIALAEGRSLRALAVMHADGSGRHDPGGPTPNAPGLVGLKCHLAPSRPIEGVTMRAFAGGYAGSISIEDGEATLAACVRASLVARFGGDHDALLGATCPEYDPRERSSEWMACPVPRSRPIRAGHPRSFRIGNAAAGVDPVGGEGIGLALWAGDRLGSLMAGADLGSIASLGGMRRSMHAAYHRRTRTRRPACHLAAESLMRPRLVRAIWPLLRVPGLSIRPWYRLTGKPSGLGLRASLER